MTITMEMAAAPCTSEPQVFHDELLQTPPARSDLTAAQWDRLTAKRASAHRQCAGCPMMVDCLYRAVVEVDVSGFVACTTEADRQAMRRQLGIEIPPTVLTPFGAPRVGGGPVSHEAVLTVRHAYPKDTCQQLAERLGCSTSTVKRHLRKAREQKQNEAAAPAKAAALPSIDAVLECFDTLETSKLA